MKIGRSLAALWQLTQGRQRIVAGILVGLLFISSSLEMGSMLILFGYIAGLTGGDAAGHRGMLRHVFDTVLGDNDMAFAFVGGALLIVVFLLKNLIATGVTFLNSRFLMKLYERAAPRLFQAFLRAPYTRFLLRGVAEPTRVVNQMLDLFNACLGSAMHVLSDTILVLTIIVLLLFVDPLLTLLAAIIFGTALVVMHFATRTLLLHMGQQAVTMQRQSTRVVGEAFGGLISSRLNATAENFVERYRNLIRGAALLNRRRYAIAQLPRMSNEVLLAAGIVAVVLYFAMRGKGLEAAIPTLALFGLAGLRLTAGLSRLSSSLQLIEFRQGDFDAMLNTIRDVAPDITQPSTGSSALEDYLAEDRPLPEGTPKRFSISLDLRGVSFAYPEGARPALVGIDITIKPRTFTAICGASGSGKSTLLLIMMGLIRPDQGEVRCDGWDIFEHLRVWHSRIGYVGQRSFLAASSIRENVAFGRRPEEIDDDRVWTVLETAQLADAVRRLPDQLGSMLGEDGSRVSAGQRQRLDIARALYNDPEILLLDEATAALDNITERELTEAISRVSESKTVICIAHRLSTVRNADIIHFVDEGRIVASDTYDRLIRDAPEFRKVAEAAQMA